MAETTLELPSRAWRLAALAARATVGALFVVTGFAKLMGMERFVEEVRKYELLPLVATNAVAYVVPWLELVAGALFLLCLWRCEARGLLAAMLVVFTAAKVYAYARGLTIECGCGGQLVFLKSIFELPQGILTNLVLLALLAVDRQAERLDGLPPPIGHETIEDNCPG